MSPTQTEAGGVLIVLCGFVALVWAALLVSLALGLCVAGVLAVVTGVLLVIVAARSEGAKEATQ